MLPNRKKCNCKGAEKLFKQPNVKLNLHSIDFNRLDEKQEHDRVLTLFIVCPKCKGAIMKDYAYCSGADTGREAIRRAVQGIRELLGVTEKVAKTIISHQLKKHGEYGQIELVK